MYLVPNPPSSSNPIYSKFRLFDELALSKYNYFNVVYPCIKMFETPSTLVMVTEKILAPFVIGVCE